ncbi:MAG: hypothetical protein Kow00121_09000 [Elainellaceae cyanobacterium]
MRAIPIISLTLSPFGLLLTHALNNGEQTNAASQSATPPAESETQADDLASIDQPVPGPLENSTLPEFSITPPDLNNLPPPVRQTPLFSSDSKAILPVPVSLPELGRNSISPDLVQRIVNRSIAAQVARASQPTSRLQPTTTANPIASPSQQDTVTQQNTLLVSVAEPEIFLPSGNPAVNPAIGTGQRSPLQSVASVQAEPATEPVAEPVANQTSTDAEDTTIATNLVSTNPSQANQAATAQAAKPEAPVAQMAVATASPSGASNTPIQSKPQPVAAKGTAPSEAGQKPTQPATQVAQATQPAQPAQTTQLTRSAQATQVAQAAPRTAAPATPLVNNANINETYVLGAGDIIQINIFNVPEYSGPQQILVDGTVNLPLVGSLPIAGQTIKQAEEAIASRYASELEYSVVTVSLSQPRALQVALAGEIAQPGLYALAANQGGQFPTVVQAIQSAGGATQAADLQQVQVRRRDQAGVLQTFSVNLLELLQTGDITQNASLRDGDIIFIPATTDINLANANQLAVSNLRSNTDQPVAVAVVGEVSQPGPYRLEGGQPTLIQLIQQSGGITPTANLRDIKVQRQTRQGAEQTIAIDLWNVLQTGDLTQDLVLQQGDRITVPVAEELPSDQAVALASSTLSTGSIQVNILGEIESPGQIELRANSTLNQAVLAAGGFNGRASSQDIKLIRFNPNGTVTQQELEVDLSQGLDPAINPLLRNNDVIVVGRSTGAEITDTLSTILDVIQLISPFPSLF